MGARSSGEGVIQSFGHIRRALKERASRTKSDKSATQWPRRHEGSYFLGRVLVKQFLALVFACQFLLKQSSCLRLQLIDL